MNNTPIRGKSHGSSRGFITATTAAALLLLFLMPVRPAFAQKTEQTPRQEAWTHEFVTANGLKLHYVTQGTGPLILFLHGFPEFWYAWKNQISEFGKTNQVIALDMPGYNLSDKPSKVADYAMPALVADLKAFIDIIAGGRKIVLVGHDWGGAVAWAYAAYYPDTLEKLIILNAPHPALFLRELQSDPAQVMASAMMYQVRDRRAEGLLRRNHFAALSDYLFKTASPTAFSDDDRKAYRDSWAQPGALPGALNYYRAADIGAPPAKGSPQLPAVTLPIITVPTLVIWGDKDPGLMPGNLNGLDKLVTHLTVKRIPNGGHWLVQDQPETVNSAIREFLQPTP